MNKYDLYKSVTRLKHACARFKDHQSKYVLYNVSISSSTHQQFHLNVTFDLGQHDASFLLKPQSSQETFFKGCKHEVSSSEQFKSSWQVIVS